MDIYVYEVGKDKSTGIHFPWLPEEFVVDHGELRASKYEILGVGPVEVPNGSNLGTIEWVSKFPGLARKGTLPFLPSNYSDPKTYEDKLNAWKKNGSNLKLIITGTSVNHNVRCAEFKYKHAGGFGDVEYEVSFRTYRDITIKTVAKATNSSNKNQTKSETTTTTTTYTIKQGDTLWGIAEKYLGKGTRNKEIYNLNKTIIENTAKKYGYKSSNNGWWIFPGVKIKIPKK
jgi:LysM repeat protein